MASILFSTGDPSGDAHAAQLIRTLKAGEPSLTCAGLGGPAMRQAGCELLEDLTQAAAIGPFDAARHLVRFTRARRLFEAYLRERRPDLVILVDFGDFNLPAIAPLAKRHGVPVLYYISPQLWAWGRFRLRYVRRYVNRMVVFFRFEETFYQQAGVPVSWVGHPLMDAARPSLSREEALRRFGLNPWRRTVGLLPGSREREVARHLPLLRRAARRIAHAMPGVQFLLPAAAGLRRDAIDARLTGADVPIRIAEGPIADALQVMEAAIVSSGTATLETALAEVPMVVVYRTSWPTYLAARAVIRVPHIAMVNIVAGRRLVPELVQHQATPSAVAREVVALLRDDERCAELREGLRQVTSQLGEPGAVGRAATAVLNLVGQSRR
jgi:lipid-A-disaccharide synthase